LEDLWGFKYHFSVALACSLASQSFVAFCVIGIIGKENMIAPKNIGLNEELLFQGQKM
jgi:hypothetical protein